MLLPIEIRSLPCHGPRRRGNHVTKSRHGPAPRKSRRTVISSRVSREIRPRTQGKSRRGKSRPHLKYAASPPAISSSHQVIAPTGNQPHRNTFPRDTAASRPSNSPDQPQPTFHALHPKYGPGKHAPTPDTQHGSPKPYPKYAFTSKYVF